MNAVTFFTPRAVSERDLAEELERRFDAGWLPDHHRFSIGTEDAVVYVDFDPADLGRLTADELRALAGQLGFVPKLALHVSPSAYHLGSAALAERVLSFLGQHLGGRVPPSTAPLDLSSGSRP